MSGGQRLDLVGTRIAGKESDGDLAAVAVGHRPDAATDMSVLEGPAEEAAADHVGPQAQDRGDLGQCAGGHLDPGLLLRGRVAVAELQTLACHMSASGDLVGGEPEAGAVLAQQRVGVLGVVALGDVVQPGRGGLALVGGSAVGPEGLRAVGGAELPVRQRFAGELQGCERGRCGHRATPLVDRLEQSVSIILNYFIVKSIPDLKINMF